MPLSGTATILNETFPQILILKWKEESPYRVKGLNPVVISKVGLVCIVQVNVVLNRTVVVDSD